MISRVRFLLPLAALCLAPSAHATDLGYVKCAVNQDRVWVYESLGSFDVEARLRCGAPVEILSRVKGYVKIRTESGLEGYVPDAAFPDLPALTDDTDKPAAAAASQSIAAAAAQRQKEAAKPAPAPASVAVNAPPAPVPAKTAAPVAAAPSPASQPVLMPVAAPNLANAAASAAAPTPAPTSSRIPTPAKPAASPAVASAPAPAKVATAAAHPKPAPATKKSEPAFDSAPAAPLVHGAPAAPAPPKPSVENVSANMRDSAVIVPATAVPAKALEESEDYPDTQPENESADPACHVYFAAYGLAPSQYKWLAENRRKEFSGICPAPDLAHVDYVVLFTHDSDTYNYAMPVPVHTDRNGFSDFSPLTTVDTALVTASEVEKARYEFVWVFRMTRGSFDPAKFSQRRKPQFNTYVKGSRAPSRAVEDAFNFVQTQGATR